MNTRRQRAMRAGWMLAAALALGPCLGDEAAAQYFGQNKARYRTFDFQVLKTEHFDIHFYEEKRAAAVEAGRMAERWYARLSTVLGHELSSRQALVLYGSGADFRATTVVPEYIGETTGGLTEGLQRRIVMPLGASLADTDHVLGHELVHAFQFDIEEEGPDGVLQLPLWFIEGMAEYLSTGPASPMTAMWLRDAVVRENLPTIAELDNPRYFPYRWGHAFWAFVTGKAGDGVVGKMLRVGAQAGSPEIAIRKVLGVDPAELSKEWHAALLAAYKDTANAGTGSTTQGARRVLRQRPGEGRLNVGPVLSPDGRLVAFFSERSQVSVDLFVADVETGEVRRKLTETAVDAHVDSLQFMSGAGAWRPDGAQFAFGTISTGRAELTLHDMASGRTVRRLPLPGIDEVSGISWAPDGKALAISGMSRGHTDLFVVDLAGGGVRRLTDDPFADVQPAWSPDGRTIAFATERFTSRLDDLSVGEFRLAVIDAAGGPPRPVAAFGTGKQATPQWSPDGAALFFVSDQAGASNVYRIALGDGSIRQVTREVTGVSGIAEMSPAFSLASNRAVYTVFGDGGYDLYALDGAALDGEPAAQASAAAWALPPAPRAPDMVGRALAASMQGLPDAGGFATGPYRPRLKLESVTPLAIGTGVSDLGAYVGGGTDVTFSDLLGHHRLSLALQSTTFGGGAAAATFSGFATYLNQKSRWDWGVRGGQIAQPTSDYASTFAIAGDQPAVVEEELTGRQTDRELSAVFARPLSRARRLEFSSGVQTVSFSAESNVRVFSLATGTLLAESTTKLPAPDALVMATASAAFVHDTSLFGGTSPMGGSRYRFEAGALSGTLDFVTLLADYRKYVPLGGPFTLAGRVMHFGRYGSGGEDPRAGDLFVGYPALVRGYDAGSFSVGDCETGTGSCPAYERLFGSRLGVWNLELRTSIIGLRGLAARGGLPSLEAALFFDGGAAWWSREVNDRLGLGKRAISSVGASLRVDILGFAVGQLSYVRPNNRPGEKWRWEFALSPGF
jgi:hypothetical protein